MSYWIQDPNGDLQEAYSFRPFSRCMNCGEGRREVSQNGGWCDSCTGETVPDAPCRCGCLVAQPPHSAYVDYWEQRPNEK